MPFTVNANGDQGTLPLPNFIYIFKMNYHVISYYLIFITLTTLYRIRLLIITNAEKLHITKLLERQMCAHARQTWE